ncbi:MFS transporter [Streptomyces sp. yr375]|uniref:MFS transporter n=1 Tax=Streptomyces sp. yr375 TaxID=1761906 RepID=UPI0015A5CFBC|nr:MFS transporter [Streptomyces sp. yr375]
MSIVAGAGGGAGGSSGRRPWSGDETTRLLFAGSLLDSLALFSTMPFLTLYLSGISTMSTVAIGVVVGSASLVPAFGGLAGGVLGDRVGATSLVQAGLVVHVIVYALLAVTRELPLVIALVVALGVARLLTEPSTKKILSQATRDSDGSVFRLRYLTWCVGAIVGPAVGAAAYAVADWMIFVPPGIVLLVYLVLLRRHAPRLRLIEARSSAEEAEPVPWSQAFADRVLLRVVLAGVVLYFVLKQLDSILPLVIKAERGESAVVVYSALLAVNAVLGIALQVPVAQLAERLSASAMVLLGSGAFAAAFLLFGALRSGTGFLFAGIVAWTLAEVILLPLPDMIIHNRSPNGGKGAYYGLAEFRYAGFCLGPVVGGGILGAAGPWPYFIVMALFGLPCWALLRAPHLHGPG